VISQHQGTSGEVRGDFILRDGKIYTWLPPEATALAGAATGPTDVIATDEWANSADPVKQRALVQLLNFALRQDVAVDCDWHGGRKVVYFRAIPDLSPRSIRGASGRSRLVFNPKYKKKAPDEISYWQHAALEWQFLYIDGQWYCALTPTYHYTRDGYRDSLFLSDLLAGIKRLDRNPAVYQQTRMWATPARRGGRPRPTRDHPHLRLSHDLHRRPRHQRRCLAVRSPEAQRCRSRARRRRS